MPWVINLLIIIYKIAYRLKWYVLKRVIAHRFQRVGGLSTFEFETIRKKDHSQMEPGADRTEYGKLDSANRIRYKIQAGLKYWIGIVFTSFDILCLSLFKHKNPSGSKSVPPWTFSFCSFRVIATPKKFGYYLNKSFHAMVPDLAEKILLLGVSANSLAGFSSNFKDRVEINESGHFALVNE